MGLLIGTGTQGGHTSKPQKLITFASGHPDVLPEEIGQKGYLPADHKKQQPALTFVATDKTDSMMDWEQVQKNVFTGVHTTIPSLKIADYQTSDEITIAISFKITKAGTKHLFCYPRNNNGWLNNLAFKASAQDNKVILTFHEIGVGYNAIPLSDDTTPYGHIVLSIKKNGNFKVWYKGVFKGEKTASLTDLEGLFLLDAFNDDAFIVDSKVFQFGCTDDFAKLLANWGMPHKYILDESLFTPNAGTYNINSISDRGTGTETPTIIDSVPCVSYTGWTSYQMILNRGVSTDKLYVIKMRVRSTTGQIWFRERFVKSLTIPANTWTDVSFISKTVADSAAIYFFHAAVAHMETTETLYIADDSVEIYEAKCTNEYTKRGITANKWKGIGEDIALITDDGTMLADVTTETLYKKYDSGEKAPESIPISIEQIYDNYVNGTRYEAVQQSDNTLGWKQTT